MAQLLDRVIAITGAGSGIGLATAREAAARGALLSLSDINHDALNSVVEDLRKRGIAVTGTQVDVSSSASVDAWITDTVQHFGRLDGVANVAGVERAPGTNTFTKITDITDDQWDFVNCVNLTGVFYCMRAQLRVMGTGGSIVNVSSMAGVSGHAGMAAYSTSKHGIIGLSRTAAKEFGDQGIRVNSLAPGFVDTPMLERIRADREIHDPDPPPSYMSVPLQRKGTPEDMARAVCFLLSDESSYTTGQVFLVDGGLNC